MLIVWPKCPGVLSTNDRLKRRIEAAPHEGEMSIVIVKKTLIGETGMISVRLVENIRIPASAAIHDEGPQILTRHFPPGDH